MKSNAFGLDIGSTSAKVVWLNQEKENYVYNTAFLANPPQQGMLSESPFDQQEMAQFINKLVVDAKITTNNVNIALPENRVFTRVIEMPVLSDKELTTAIYWEAEQYIPAALDTMNLDWSILKKPSEQNSTQKMQVLLVAAPKQLVGRYQSILEMAGLTVVAVETEVLSLIRGIIGKDTTHFPTSLLMNIGASTSSLAIIQNGIVIFVYTIPLGGIAITRAIASDFGFTPVQAEEYKRAYGLSNKNFSGKIRNAIEPILVALITEVKKALTFYNEKYKMESPISEILLTGGSSNLSAIGTYFAQALSMETVIANPWKMLTIQSVPKEVELRGPEFTIALGLALKEYE